MRGSVRKVRHLGIAFGIAAVTAILAAASPAEASHGRGRGRDNGPRFSISIRHGDAISCAPRHSHRSCESIEFDRGFKEGECEGYEAGLRDGRLGRSYCDHPSHIHCGSRAFERGFEAGWAHAYAAGYDEGRCERYSRRPHVHRHYRH